MSNTTSTVKKSSRKGLKTASSTKPQSSETLTISSSPVQLKNTRAISTYLQQAFPANHLALQERKKAKTTKETSGRRRSNVFAMFDPDTHSWKTSQVCLILDTSAKSSLRWPKQGLMQDGVCSEQTMWVHRTVEKDSGYWPTPNTLDSLPPKSPEALLREATVTRPGRRQPANLRDAVSNMKFWPTPTASTNGPGKNLDNPRGIHQGNA